MSAGTPPTVAYLGEGDGATAPLPLWSDQELLDNVYTGFKLRFAIEPYNPCPKVSSVCPSFLSVTDCIKMHLNL